MYIEIEDNRCFSPHPKLIYDEACLDIVNKLEDNILIQGQYSECDKCLLRNFTTIAPNANYSMVVNSKYMMKLQYQYNDTICRYLNIYHFTCMLNKVFRFFQR